MILSSQPIASQTLVQHARFWTPDVGLFSDLATVPLDAEQSWDKTTVPTTEARNGVSTTPCSSREHVLPSPNILHHACITTDVVLPRKPLQPMSPATRLPAEIITYIFEFCLAGESTPIPVPRQGPFRLTQVCKLWRAVAESAPHLWTSIHIYFPESRQGREQDVSTVKPVLDLHLKRSGALPISLTFTDHRFYHIATEGLVALLVDRLRTHSCRWRCISLRLSCGYFPLLFTFVPCNLSSLEHLYISGDVFGQRAVATLHLNLESAKNLTSFAYSGPGHAVYDKIDLSWEQLTEVSFEFGPHYGMSSTLSRHLKRLPQCRNITTCSLGIDRPFWSDFGHDETITLPYLRTLRVRRLSLRSHVRSAIDPLVLPQLQTLEIDAAFPFSWDGLCRPWHERNFSNLLARSGCALRRLSIQDVDFPNDELVRCLALSPTVTSLRFIPYPRSQDIAGVICALDVSRTTLAGGRCQSGDRVRVQIQGGDRDGRKHVVDGPLVPGLREITLASSAEEYLNLMMGMCRSRGSARARSAEVSALRRVEAVFFDVPHVTDKPFPGDRVARLKRRMAEWVSEIEDGNDDEKRERLEGSVVVESPYLAEYV